MDFTDLIYKCEDSNNSKLYEFLATHYDISSLASKIKAQTKAPLKLSAWKKAANNAGA